MFLRTFQLIAALSCALLLAGCASPAPEGEQSEPAPVSDQSQDGTMVGSADTGGVSMGDPLDDPSGLLSTRIVYFEYDRSDILKAARFIIEAHGSYLANNPDAAVTLEGHADERGSREYNIALSEARGNAVRQHMLAFGALDTQIRVIAYGEERPAVDGHDETAWSQNRRVEIIYRDR